MTNQEIKREALELVRGKRTAVVLGLIIVAVISSVLSFIPFVGYLASIFIAGPIALGTVILSLKIVRKEDVEVATIFSGFKNAFAAFVTNLVMGLFTLLWSLLLIVPGIIKGFSYSMTMFILADNPTISATDAITRSRELMNGNKWKFFCLNFSFIGWHILALFTFGILYIWLTPYILAAQARFYQDLIGEKEVTNSLEYQEIKVEENKCPLCGKINDQDATFCVICGEKLK